MCISTVPACCQRNGQCFNFFFAYINPAVKQKKPWLINTTVCLNVPQKHPKKFKLKQKTWSIHWVFWTWFSRFPSQDSQKKQDRFYPFLDHFFHCPWYLLMEYFDAHNFMASIMRVIASLVFLILCWFS